MAAALSEGEIVLALGEGARGFALDSSGKLGKVCVLVSSAESWRYLKAFLRSKKIDLKDVFVIDCISKVEEEIPEGENRVQVGGLSKLITLSISIDNAIMGEPAARFVIFDSLEKFFLYNGADRFKAFVYPLLTRLRIKGIGCLLAAREVPGFSEELGAIGKVCDRTVRP
jgi:hypothetical protein